MRGTTRISLLAAIFAIAIAIAGCGSDDEGTIPSDQSDTLLSLLSSVENSVNDGNCELAQKTAEELVDTVNNLPADVDNEVQSALTKASEQLVNLAENPEQCVDDGTTGAGGVEETTTTDTTSTTTVEPTETTTTETSTTEEPQTTPQDETPTEDPNIAPGNGQGNPGNGQGNPGVGGPGNGGPATGGVEPGGKR